MLLLKCSGKNYDTEQRRNIQAKRKGLIRVETMMKSLRGKFAIFFSLLSLFLFLKAKTGRAKNSKNVRISF